MTIDATGQVLAPGFIDIHTHSDVTLLDNPGGESKAYQGVTTEVTGNCSYSPFPVGAPGPEPMRGLMRSALDASPLGPGRPRRMGPASTRTAG